MAVLVADIREEITQKQETFNASRLDPVAVEVIDLFVQFSRALGQPRSVAEIYGLLFISHHPLAMDELIERLDLSKGSASQGLKYLQELGAVRTVYVAGERRTHYQAVAELRHLAGSFLRQQILTHFEDSEARLARIPADDCGGIPADVSKHKPAVCKLVFATHIPAAACTQEPALYTRALAPCIQEPAPLNTPWRRQLDSRRTQS